MPQKILVSLKNALRGWRQTYLLDQSFRLEIALGLPVFAVVAYLLWPLSLIEISLLVLAYGLIISGEFFNTSIETLLDRLHPEEHEEIRASKDMAAAAMLTIFIIAAIIVALLLAAEYGVIY